MDIYNPNTGLLTGDHVNYGATLVHTTYLHFMYEKDVPDFPDLVSLVCETTTYPYTAVSKTVRRDAWKAARTWTYDLYDPETGNVVSTTLTCTEERSFWRLTTSTGLTGHFCGKHLNVPWHLVGLACDGGFMVYIHADDWKALSSYIYKDL